MMSKMILEKARSFFVLTTIIKQRKVCNLPTFAYMLDFEEAFDKTDRSMLSRRLESKFLYLCQIYVPVNKLLRKYKHCFNRLVTFRPQLETG